MGFAVFHADLVGGPCNGHRVAVELMGLPIIEMPRPGDGVRTCRYVRIEQREAPELRHFYYVWEHDPRAGAVKQELN